MARSFFIDLREEELNAYIFDFKKGKYETAETRKFPVSNRFDFSLDAARGDIENSYLSLPLSLLNFRVVELPFSDNDRIREVLPFELDGIILGGTDKVILDDVVVGTSEGKYQVLAVYAEKNHIMELLSKLKSYNLDPVFITSIELRNVIKDFDLSRLLSHETIDDKDRITLAEEEIKAPTINLRREGFSYTRDSEKTRKSLKITAALLVLLMLVFSADLLVKMITTKYEIASLRNEMRKNYQELFPAEKNVINELYQLKSHMKELKGKEDLYLGADSLNVLLKLSRLEKQGTVFNEITADKGYVFMKGEAPSLSDIQQLKNKLEGLFNEVAISDSRSSAQGKMLFTIKAKEIRT